MEKYEALEMWLLRTLEKISQKYYKKQRGDVATDAREEINGQCNKE